MIHSSGKIADRVVQICDVACILSDIALNFRYDLVIELIDSCIDSNKCLCKLICQLVVGNVGGIQCAQHQIDLCQCLLELTRSCGIRIYKLLELSNRILNGFGVSCRQIRLGLFKLCVSRAVLFKSLYLIRNFGQFLRNLVGISLELNQLVQLCDVCFENCNISLKLRGVDGRYADLERNLAYGRVIIGRLGVLYPYSDRRADNYAFVNGDLITVHAITVTVKDSERNGLDQLIKGGGGRVQVHNVARHDFVKRCAEIDLWSGLLNLKGSCSRVIAADHNGSSTRVYVVFVGYGTTEIVGGCRNIQIDIYRRLMPGAIVDKFLVNASHDDLSCHKLNGSDHHIVIQSNVIVIGRALDDEEYVVRTCVDGCAFKGSTATHINDRNVLKIKGSRMRSNTDLLHRLVSIGGGEVNEVNVGLGERCLSYDIGRLCLTGVIAHALNADLRGTCICKIIAVGIINREVHALRKLYAANGNGNDRLLLCAIIRCTLYSDDRVGR